MGRYGNSTQSIDAINIGTQSGSKGTVGNSISIGRDSAYGNHYSVHGITFFSFGASIR